jgi:hypothetical protein
VVEIQKAEMQQVLVVLVVVLVVQVTLLVVQVTLQVQLLVREEMVVTLYMLVETTQQAEVVVLLTKVKMVKVVLVELVEMELQIQ